MLRTVFRLAHGLSVVFSNELSNFHSVARVARCMLAPGNDAGYQRHVSQGIYRKRYLLGRKTKGAQEQGAVACRGLLRKEAGRYGVILTVLLCTLSTIAGCYHLPVYQIL